MRLSQPAGVAKESPRPSASDAVFGPARPWLLGLFLVVATVTAYQPARQGGFIWDDDAYVTENPLLVAPDGLQRIWFSRDSPSQYFPLTYTVLRLEREFWGLNAFGYHWASILLHTVNVLLLWFLLRRLALPGAWLAAGLFALHPVQVETVAWITEQKNLLSLFFSLLAVWAWIKFLEERRSPWKYYAGALALYLLALFAKTTACTLPAALAIVSWLRTSFGESDQTLATAAQEPIPPVDTGQKCRLALVFLRTALARARILQLVPFLVLGCGMGLLTVWWERYHQGTGNEILGLGPSGLGGMERVLVASRAIWFYASKLAWPYPLLFSYPRWNIEPNSPLAYIWLVFALAGCGAVCLLGPALRRWAAGAGLFYVATLSPLLGFFMLYTFRYSFVADHYQYVACIGPFTLLAAGMAWALRRPTQRGTRFAGKLVCVAVLLILAGLTRRQACMYRDSETLWRTTLAHNPSSFLAHYQLGKALLQKGDIALAIAEYQKVLDQQPNDADVHYNLANVFLRSGRIDEAVAHYFAVLKIHPQDPDAHNNLGSAMVRKEQYDAAIDHFEQALRLRPDSPDAGNNLGYVAWVLATTANTAPQKEKALALAQKVNRLYGGSNPQVLRTLATAYAGAGRFAEAIEAAQNGLRLAMEHNNSALANALRQELGSYLNR